MGIGKSVVLAPFLMIQHRACLKLWAVTIACMLLSSWLPGTQVSCLKNDLRGWEIPEQTEAWGGSLHKRVLCLN